MLTSLTALFSGSSSSGPLENLSCSVCVEGGGSWRPPQLRLPVLEEVSCLEDLESKSAVSNVELHQCLILWFPKNRDPPSPPGYNHWTLFTLFFFILDKWKHAWGCFFFLPQFSKDSDASGLAPTLSINQFLSNKCGIFSSSCVHSHWLRKAVWLCFFYTRSSPPELGSWMFRRLSSHLTLVLDSHHHTLSAFQALLVLHTPVSWPAWPWLFTSHPASITFRMLLNQSARSSYRTTGFYLWRNKDAPQTGVWAFLLYHGVCSAFSCFLSIV